MLAAARVSDDAGFFSRPFAAQEELTQRLQGSLLEIPLLFEASFQSQCCKESKA